MVNKLSATVFVACLAGTGCKDGATVRATSTEAALTSALPVVVSSVQTPSLANYAKAPRTPDTDDPAFWVPREGGPTLVLATLKNSGLQVYDLEGHVLQTVLPPKRPAITAADPIAPGPREEASTGACSGSDSGKTFGRFNNVDVIYGVRLGHGRKARKVDVAVMTDRGCDRVRSYAIDPTAPDGPLVDITDEDAPRVFPDRFEQPWALLDPNAETRVVANPIDDQNTAYGITAFHAGGEPRVLVTQRKRGVVRELALVATDDGHLRYEVRHDYRFPAAFALPGERTWTPCREDAGDDPQLEGLVVDEEEGVFYAAHEVVGLWRVPLAGHRRVVDLAPKFLFEPVRTFANPYWAVPDDGAYACAYNPSGEAPAGSLVGRGAPELAGTRLNADVEGLAIHEGRRGRTLLVSSQGDDTFHAFDLNAVHLHPESGSAPGVYRGSFVIAGVGETDGHAVTPGRVGRGFPFGAFAVQNGKAPPPSPESETGTYDHSTRLELVPWERISAAFTPPLPL